jgi:hypothetical protein
MAMGFASGAWMVKKKLGKNFQAFITFFFL